MSTRRADRETMACPAGALEGPSPCFETKKSRLFLCHVDMWWIGPMWPSALLATKKASFGKEDMPFGHPTYHGKENFILFLPFMGQKVVFQTGFF